MERTGHQWRGLATNVKDWPSVERTGHQRIESPRNMGGQQSSCVRLKDDSYRSSAGSFNLNSDCPPDLTADEKRVLKQSWKELEEKIVTVGVITFTGQVFDCMLQCGLGGGFGARLHS